MTIPNLLTADAEQKAGYVIENQTVDKEPEEELFSGLIFDTQYIISTFLSKKSPIAAFSPPVLGQLCATFAFRTEDGTCHFFTPCLISKVHSEKRSFLIIVCQIAADLFIYLFYMYYDAPLSLNKFPKLLNHSNVQINIKNQIRSSSTVAVSRTVMFHPDL